ncbi:MAG: CvpA family protein [Porphyromonadaceae bacterium]|jgi:membrane protein required for colicin V production|nr:CvpA family protein [Porphyromonadaceae bacterium]
MNTFDLFIFIPVALGLIFGLFKGFVKEVVSLLAIIIAIVVAEFLSGRFAPVLGNWFNLSDKMATTVSYALIFIFTVLVAFLLSNLTDKMIKNISLGWLNSILGGVFGALKIAIIVSVLMNVFDALDSKFQFADPAKKEASYGYYPVLKLAPKLWKSAKETYEVNKNKYFDNPTEEPDSLKSNEKSREKIYL